MSTQTYHGLILEKNNHTAILTLNNPPANVWTEKSLKALVEVINELNADHEIYSLILTGQGGKFFSAGADLHLFKNGDKEVASNMARSFGFAFETLSNFRGVSIAAINGYAMGGGLECALACDLRITEEQSVLALPEASVGLLPCAGGTQWLSWLVGEGWAKRLILCGEHLDAETALRIRLVEEVTSSGKALTSALALAQKINNQSPTSIAACKRLIQAARNIMPNQALPHERVEFVKLFDSMNQREGVNAFLEKRAPHWLNT
ncbi:enoyl-CoA hydratase [Alcaligenes sp. 13f]|uniref:enoyl-CoA hydratase n=1 Tax=Alcaligenes sp. 13f TaxID=2841924 RepID=UPI001CF64785|nr:enoyl-CoA hydratase [Alcaligenes sp. 13f]MCB4321565.1 enoyl-CoA hydratase [Alcaligenes sp. 13f]